MRKKYLFIIAILLVANLKGQILNLPYLGASECGNWCWANVCRHIIVYYGYDNLTSCEIAEYARTQDPNYFGSVNCCQDITQGCCKGNSIEGTGGMLEILNHWGIGTNYTTFYQLTISEITTELSNNRPFIIRYPGHVNLGYGINGSNIYIRDPGWGWDIRDYNLLISDTTNNGHYQWESTIRMTNSPVTCEYNKSLTGTVSNSGLYKASGNYDVYCTINNNSTVTVKAPVNITLNSGFTISLGSSIELNTGNNLNTNCP